MWHQTPAKCAILSPEPQKLTIKYFAISKFWISGHKIAHLATSRWHRTEQHAIEGSKYRVGLQDASQAQLIAQTDKKDKKDAIYYPCTSFFMFDTKSVGILAIWGGRAIGQRDRHGGKWPWLMWHQTPAKCAVLSPETRKTTLVQWVMSKFRVCWHKIAHLATSRWHRTEQHGRRAKYWVGLQDAA